MHLSESCTTSRLDTFYKKYHYLKSKQTQKKNKKEKLVKSSNAIIEQLLQCFINSSALGSAVILFIYLNALNI